MSAVPKNDPKKEPRAVTLLRIVSSSEHDGERVNALRALDRLLRAEGKDWLDLLPPFEALQTLLAEVEQLRAKLAAEEQRTNGTAVAVWTDIGTDIARHHRTAIWALDLHAHGRIWLGPKELDFLGKTIPRWSGPLQPKQHAWLQHIVDRIVERTGLTPP